MSKITPDDIRAKVKEVGLTYVQVCDGAGVGLSWFYKMMLEPSENHKRKYNYINPNPEWMKKVMKFLNAYARLKAE